MKENQIIFYLSIILISLALALVGGLFLDISFGNPQKSKYHYIFQKYYLKKNQNMPKNFSGIWKDWDRNGNLEISTQLKDGVMHGEQLVWSNGDLTPNYVYKNQFYKNGKLHGKQEYLRPNGDKISLSIWENGQQNGDHIQYYANNKIKYKEEYKNNKLDGVFIGFYENGTKKMEGNFKADKPKGTWCFWSEDGKISSKLNGENNAYENSTILLLAAKFKYFESIKN